MSQLQNELQEKKICRFCLTQQVHKLESIYSKSNRTVSSAPLTVQVMAITSIEIFSNDGMPQYICSYCRLLFEHSYRFKQMCKRAETLLRQFELTGQWPSPLPKPKIPNELIQISAEPQKAANTTTVTTNTSTSFMSDANVSITKSNVKHTIKKSELSEVMPRKILNLTPADSPEPPIPMRLKKEKIEDEPVVVLEKIQNNEFLKDEEQGFNYSADDNEKELLASTTRSSYSAKDETIAKAQTKAKHKLLNKSSIRILNKDAEVVIEPRFSAPTLKRDDEGNVAMVTEIIDPSVPYEGDIDNDPVKNAEPLETDCFPCSHCERSFPLRQLRDIHMVNHSRQRNYQCPECEKSFFSKYDLQKHNLIHTGDRPYKCIVCDKAFTRPTLLHRHEKTHTDIPKYICIHCEKPFISKQEMEQHNQRHLKHRPFKCRICDKSFAFKQGVERHEVTHQKEQPYPCQYCQQSFSTPSKLARHLTAHAGTRPYPCKFCPKSYVLSHHLTRHMRSHKQGNATFTCASCNKQFNSRDDLIYHSAVHATKTLTCPLCKDTFEDLQSVTHHIKLHADGEAFACEYCDLFFITSARLVAHTNTHTVEDMLAGQQVNNEGDAEAEFNNPENLRSMEETIEEFLVDELSNEAELNENQDFISPEHMKQEIQSAQDQQPQILTHIIFKNGNKYIENGQENQLNPNEDDIVVVNEPIHAIDTDDNALPAKIRKVESYPKEPGIVLKQAPNLKNTTEVCRKLPKPKQSSSPQTNPEKNLEIKTNKSVTTPTNTKKSSQPTITSIINNLPKGMSIRRNTSNNESKDGTTQSPAATISPPKNKIETPKTTPLIKQRVISRRSNEVTPAQVSNRVEQKITTEDAISKSRLLNKSIGATASPNLAASSSSKSVNLHVKQKSPMGSATAGNKQSPNAGTKTMKMMLGDKKVKVQKIIVTKAEAAAMAKEGRIQMKDGAMIFTKPINK